MQLIMCRPSKQYSSILQKVHPITQHILKCKCKAFSGHCFPNILMCLSCQVATSLLLPLTSTQGAKVRLFWYQMRARIDGGEKIKVSGWEGWGSHMWERFFCPHPSLLLTAGVGPPSARAPLKLHLYSLVWAWLRAWCGRSRLSEPRGKEKKNHQGGLCCLLWLQLI